MGFVAHHAIIVTGFDERINIARSKADELGMQPTEVVFARINDYRTFLIPPDGSKEGWEESDEGDRRRYLFIAWLNQQAMGFEWCEVRFGSDAEGATIERTRWNMPEEESE